MSSTMSSTSLTKLAGPDLVVIPSDSLQFRDAITSRAFNGKLQNDLFPHAVLQAKSVAAVQKAVQYCSSNNLKVCVRSGGHSWETTWLQGDTSIVLDVGDLNSIQVQDGSVVSVGPGATGDAVLEAALAQNLFFPGPHCQGVAVGGFLLGGGFGIGYTSYGMACNYIQELDVVLADGSLFTATKDSKDPKAQALLQLARGSYAAFTGVITRYQLGPLPPKPTVYRGMVLFPLPNWKQALELGRSTSQERVMETTVVLTYAPPPIAQATGVSVAAIVALDIYADNGLELWEQYVISEIQAEDLLVPLDPPNLCSDLNTIPNSMFYPSGSRFQTQVYTGRQGILAPENKDDLHAILQPLVDLWLSPTLPPPSHTLLVCAPPTLEKTMAYGFEPGLNVMTYAVYTRPEDDDDIQTQLATACGGMIKSDQFYTSLVEGRTRQNGASSGFTPEALEQTKESIGMLDPEGVFAGFPKQE